MSIDHICVIGAGGHGKVVVRLLQDLGKDVAAIFDDNPRHEGTLLLGVPILGAVDRLVEFGFHCGVLAIGDNSQRQALAAQLPLTWLTVIHPRAHVDRTARLGEGTVVCAGAVVQADVVIGQHVIINTSASIDHDCRIGHFAHVAPGCRLAGNVEVGEGVLLGIGAAVCPGIRIGAGATIGAGGVVVQDIEERVVAVGVPAKSQRQGDGHVVARRNMPLNALSSNHVSTDIVPLIPPRIYLSPPHMSGTERQLLLEAFDSNWIAPLGPHVDAFEREFAVEVGVDHAVALVSGTAALHLSLLLLGVQPGDEVLTATLTFAATVNPIRYVGAEPVFIDSELHSWNMAPDLLADELEACARRGKLPKAVIVVDIIGQCADYEPILKTCRAYGVPVVEDAAEAIGASYCGRPAGSFGDIGCFSFNGNKIITTSGGGMLVTNRADWAQQARFLATQARDPAPHYEHSVIGYNYRMSNLLAAVGRGQLQLLRERVRQRRAVCDYYQQHLGHLPGICFMPELAKACSTRWLTCILVDPDQFGASREDIRLALEKANIEARPVWKPMHQQPVFAHCRRRGGIVADEIFRCGLCLPSGSSLTSAELTRIVDIICSLTRIPQPSPDYS